MMIDEIYNRETPIDLKEVEVLGIDQNSDFFRFYEQNEGVFSSENTGYRLLDITTGPESIATQSKLVHEEFGIPSRYLVISDYLGNGVLMYDKESSAVFNLDFEGGDKELISGRLVPDYDSFNEFIHWYFGEKL